MTQGNWRRRAIEPAPAGSARIDRGADERDRFIAQLQEHHQQMRGLAIRILHDPEAADDALQNAYIKAYQRRDSFRGDAAMSTWLYTIVYRSCIDEHRRRKPTVPFDEATSPRADGGPWSQESFDDIVDHRLGLRDALTHLSPAQRAAIWLVDAEGMTFVEASEVLGVPPGTIASRVSRARNTLRGVLADQHPGRLGPNQSGNRPEERS